MNAMISMRHAALVLIAGTVLSTTPADAETRRFRLVWANDPTTTATVGWEQVSGGPAVVHYDRVDHGTEVSAYAHRREVDREEKFRGMHNCFARLTGLEPDTAYYFVVVDDDGPSRRFYFRTAPAVAKPFAFVAGGDSRNYRKPRRKANRLVRKLRPLFVAFTGDMINKDENGEWWQWFDDWQQTIADDGRMFPVLPHRGNHESGGNEVIARLFDTTPGNYYALDFGGDLMRFYVLNSEIPAGGKQGAWLEGDLTEHAPSIRHLCVGYHKPMRPVVLAKAEGADEYDQWAEVFHRHGVDLVFESDSHSVKRTKPLVPSTGPGSVEGFTAAYGDPNATVYVGEGCWGAPLRAADDAKPWMLASGSFNSFELVHVYEDRMEVRTVRVDSEAGVGGNAEGDELGLPAGLAVWEPASGAVLTVEGDGGRSVVVATLETGAPRPDLSGAAGQERLFRLRVPAGASDLEFRLSGGEGNADLFVNARTLPEVDDHQFGSSQPGNDERIAIESPEEGAYLVMVRGTTAFSGVTLEADCTAPVVPPVRVVTAFPRGSEWSYHDAGTAPDPKWKQPGALGWPKGRGQLGYGDGDEETTLQGRHLAYYFRRSVTLRDIDEISNVEFDLLYDDGAILHLNGVQAYRTASMPSGPVNARTPTDTRVGENTRLVFSVDPALLVEGENVIAVQVHNQSTSSSDISFDLAMRVTRPGGAGVAGYLRFVAEHRSAAGETAPEQDHNGNGIPNFAEYAFGLDPFDPVTELSHLPRLVDGEGPAIEFVRRPDPGIRWVHQVSADRADWRPGVEGEDFRIEVREAGDLERVRLIPLDETRKTFFRVEPVER